MKRIFDQKGALLLEAALGLPVLLILLAALCGVFVVFQGIYLNILSDSRLQAEAASIMERVTGDLKNSRPENISVKSWGDFSTVVISRPWEKDPSRRRVAYSVADTARVRKIMWSSVGAVAPVTGESIIGETDVRRFYFVWLNPNLLRGELVMVNTRTRKRISLITVLHLPRVSE